VLARLTIAEDLEYEVGRHEARQEARQSAGVDAKEFRGRP